MNQIAEYSKTKPTSTEERNEINKRVNKLSKTDQEVFKAFTTAYGNLEKQLQQNPMGKTMMPQFTEEYMQLVIKYLINFYLGREYCA